MGKKVKSLLRVFFPNKKKKKKDVVNNTNDSGKSAATKSSNIKEQRVSTTSATVVSNPSSTKLELVVDTTTSTTIGAASTDLTIDPTFSSSSTPSSSSLSPTSSPVSSTDENRSRTSTSTSGDLSFERHLAAATTTTTSALDNEEVSTKENQEIKTDDSLLSHLDEETVTKVRAFERHNNLASADTNNSVEEVTNGVIEETKTAELVSSAVFEETLTKLHKRTSSTSSSILNRSLSGGIGDDNVIVNQSFDETVESHEQFNYKLENSITETQLEYVSGGLYVEDTEIEEECEEIKKCDNMESEEIKCDMKIECKVEEKEVADSEECEEKDSVEIEEEIEPSCPSPIRGGGGCCSTLPEVTTTTAAIEEAAFETSRSSRLEGVRAALEKATREDEEDVVNVEEEIESPPPSPGVTVEEVPNEKEEEKAEVVSSSSTISANVSPPTTTGDGGRKSSSSTEALAWTALSALMTAPAPQAIQQKKTRTPTNLWQHGELGEDQAGENESDLDNISIACSSIACSDGAADISLRDDDGYMDLVSTGVGGGVEVVADDIVPQVEEDKGVDVVESSVNQSIESNESSSTTASTSSSLSANKPKKVQFSLRGEQARQRAIARQKKILSKASLRLGAISETSLENIEEHDQLNVVAIDDCDDSVGVSSSMPSLSFACDTDMESIMEGSELASIGGGGINDCSSSVRSIVSHQVIGEGKGGICSISFYEAAAASEGNKKLLDNSSELLVQEEETKKDEVVEPVVQGDDIQSSPEVQADVAQVVDIASKDGDKQEEECIEFFVLLLCPTSRIFELVEIKNAKLNSTVQDIMDIIPQQCTDERLLSKSYTGFVRPTDRIEFMQMDTKVFAKQQQSQLKGEDDDEKLESISIIQEDDVLVAILEGYSGYQMVKISKPILKNSKFRDMLSRRSKNPRKISTRRSSSGDDKSTRSSRSVRSSHSKRKRNNRSKRRSGGSSLPREIAAGKSRSSSKSSSKYSSITQKLEDLSKKLHDVDDEIEADDQSEAKGKKLPSTPEKAPLVKEDDMEDEATIAASILEEVGSSANLSCYKMTPKMVAYELASNIEDIFADHDVDIVAVDSYNADFNLDDDDLTKSSNDDTFVSAKSMLNMSDARSIRSLARQINSSSPVKPVLEITTKKKRERKSKPSKFSNYEEDDMMLQIEAMARQADEAFQSRKKMSNLWDDAGTSSTSKKPVTVSREKLKEKLAAAVSKADVDVMEKKKIQEDTDSKPKAVVPQEDDKEVAGITAGNVASAMIKKDDTAPSNTSSSERTFLNTSTSMVSTMVAASQGRVNEVHVLQYLGVTIVCIAANFMQHTRKAATCGGTKGKDSSFIPKTILESAMFLAFMVNGQRYLAKVTKKEKKEGTESI